MSMMSDSTILACQQRASANKTMEKRVSTVILNVYQSTGIEKEEGSRLSLENHRKLDEVRRFYNKKFEEEHDVHRNLASSEQYSRISEKGEYQYVSGVMGMAYNPFLDSEAGGAHRNHEVAELLKFWTERIMEIDAVEKEGPSLGLILEKTPEVVSIPRSDKRVEVNMGDGNGLLTTNLGTSINIFVRGVGVGLTHTENLMIKKLKEVRETSELELEEEEPEPTIGRNFKTKFEIPNEYSENIMITDSDFILSNRTSAICITADMSFKSRLEADFKREYQNVEFLFRQRPGLGGMAALPPSVAQVPGKYLCFLVTRVNDRNTIDPEHVILALTRLRDFMIERGITEVSMPVYDPNRGKLSPRELYAILHVVFAETEIMVYLHKKYYLSIA